MVCGLSLCQWPSFVSKSRLVTRQRLALADVTSILFWVTLKLIDWYFIVTLNITWTGAIVSFVLPYVLFFLFSQVKRLKVDITRDVANSLLPNDNKYLYPTDTSSTCSPTKSILSSEGSSVNSQQPTITSTSSNCVDITESEPTIISTPINLLQQRTRELDRATADYARLKKDHEILQIKMCHYRKGFEKLKATVNSTDPMAPLPRYLFDKRMPFKKSCSSRKQI